DTENRFADQNELQVKENSRIMEALNSDMDQLNDRFTEMKDSLILDIESKINQSRIKIDQLFQNQDRKMNAKEEEMDLTLNQQLEFFKEEAQRIEDLLNRIDEKFQYQFDNMLQNADNQLNEQLSEMGKQYHENMAELKGQLSDIEDQFSERVTEIENYYREQTHLLLQEKVDFITQLENKLENLTGSIHLYENDLEEHIYTQIKNGKEEIEQIMKKGQENLHFEYEQLEEETKKSLSQYKEQITSIKSNLENLDAKYNYLFLDKLQEADDLLKNQITLFNDKYLERMDTWKADINQLKENYKEQMEESRTLFEEQQNQITSEKYLQLEDYSHRIEELVGQIGEVKELITTEIHEKIAEGKAALEGIIINERSKFDAEYASLFEKTSQLARQYEKQLENVKNGMRSLEEQLSLQVNEKIVKVDDKIYEKFEKVNEKYADHIASINQKISGLEQKYKERLQELEKGFEEKGTKMADTQYEKMSEVSAKFHQLNLEYHDLKNQINQDIKEQLQLGKEQILEYKQSVEEDFITSLNQYKEDIQKTKADITVLDHHIKVDMQQKLDNLDEKWQSSLAKVNTIYQDKINTLHDEYQTALQKYTARIDEIEKDYQMRGEQALRENQANLENIKGEYENFLTDFELLKQRMDIEIREQIEQSVSQTMTQITEQNQQLQSNYNQLEYQINEHFQEVKEQFLQFQSEAEGANSDYQDRLDELTKILTAKTDQVENKAIEKLQKLTEKMDSMKVMLEETQKESADEMTQNSMNQLKQFEELFNQKKIEIQNNFEQWQSNALTNITTYKTDVAQLQSDIDNLHEGLQDKLNTQFEIMDQTSLQQLENLKEKIREIEIEFGNRIDTREKSYFSQAVKKFTILNSKMNDLNQSINLIEGKFKDQLDQKLVENKEHMNKIVEAHNQDLIHHYQQIEQDALLKLASYKAEIERLKNVIENTNDDITTIVDKKLDEADETIILKLNQLADQVVLMENDLQEKVGQIESEYQEKHNQQIMDSQLNISRLSDRLNELNDEISQIKGNIDTDIHSRIEEGKNKIHHILEKGAERLTDSLNQYEQKTAATLNQYNDDLNIMKDQIESLTDLLDQTVKEKMNGFDLKLVAKYEEISEGYDHNVDMLKNKIKQVEQEYQSKLEEYEADYQNQTEALVISNNEKYLQFVDSFKALSLQLSDIKENINGDIKNMLDKGQQDMLNLYQSGEEKIHQEYQKLEDQTLEKMNKYRSELFHIQQNISEVDRKYSDLFVRKLNEFDTKMNNKMATIDQNYDQHITQLNQQITSIEDNYQQKLAGIEDEFFKKGEKYLVQNLEKLDTFEAKYNQLNQQIKGLEAIIDDEVALKIAEGKSELKDILIDQIEEMKLYYQSVDQDLFEKLGEYKKEVGKIQKTMKDMDDRFTARFLEHSSILDKRIAEIEDDLNKLTRQTANLGKASQFKEKLSQDIKEIKEYITTIKKDKSEIVEIEQKMVSIQNSFKISEEKYKKVISDSKKVDNISAVLHQLKQVTESVDDKINGIKSAKIMITNLENNIDSVSEKFLHIEESLAKVQEKESDIQSSLSELDQYKEESQGLARKINNFHKQLEDLNFKKNTFEKSLKNF
ncbi:MAG: hypothetical protein MJB14_01370, partial [Spirochaetes bacterium]|nr:hypothetical protein [Spirochaetota bacterium]